VLSGFVIRSVGSTRYELSGPEGLDGLDGDETDPPDNALTRTTVDDSNLRGRRYVINGPIKTVLRASLGEVLDRTIRTAILGADADSCYLIAADVI
jgi:hypothetical protein